MVSFKCSDCDRNSSSQASAEATDLSQSLPRLSISSAIGSNIPRLTALDADLNMPADENFSYYSTHDFHDNNDIAQCFQTGQTFSVINCHIRSLSANFDSLVNMLSELYFPLFSDWLN